MNAAYKGFRLFGLLLFDLTIGLFLWWLILDSPRRWPFLVIVIPAVLIANLVSIRRTLGNRRSIALPIIYGCGLFYGICLTIAHFEWWKLLVLIVPAILLIKSVLYDPLKFLRDDQTIPRS
jgi:hypothetical protein